MFKLRDYSPVESGYFWCGPEEEVWVSKALAAGFVFLPAPHFAELKEIIKKNATLKALFHHLISLVPPIVALVLTETSNSSLMAF